MSGNFFPVITFPFYPEDAKSGRVQLEPILTLHGHGVALKVILELIGGVGEKKYTYERVYFQDVFMSNYLKDNIYTEALSDFFEGFYFNKITQDVALPVTALFLKMYYGDLVEQLNIQCLHEYVLDVDHKHNTKIGFSSGM